MYAIVRQGSHQYRVKPGDVIQVEKIEGTEKGQEILFEDVLAVRNGSDFEVGAPRVSGAAVKVRVLRNDRAAKVTVFTFKRRKGYQRKLGHRQPFTEVRVLAVVKNGTELSAS